MAVQASEKIKLLASKAAKGISDSESVCRKVLERTRYCPVNYMRYGEFDAILSDLELKPGMKVLDVSSPQWLSIYLADKYPEVDFLYINIIDEELEPFREIADAVNLSNLRYLKGDVRELELDDNSFDRVISVSVIEHVYPEEDGDLKALHEIRRVLKPGGELLMTLPFKNDGNIVYMDGPVYERNGQERKFYAREYDQQTFDKLISSSGLSKSGVWYICEKHGIYPVDYYEWGPGKGSFKAKCLFKLRRLSERIFRKPLDKLLAQQHLRVLRELAGRPANISARLQKA